MDSRGHGNSEMGPAQELSISTYADVCLIDHLNLPEVIMGGISMGSAISLNLALKAGDRIKGLALIRPAWQHQPIPDNLRILHDMANFLYDHDLQETENYFLGTSG